MRPTTAWSTLAAATRAAHDNAAFLLIETYAAAVAETYGTTGIDLAASHAKLAAMGSEQINTVVGETFAGRDFDAAAFVAAMGAAWAYISPIVAE